MKGTGKGEVASTATFESLATYSIDVAMVNPEVAILKMALMVDDNSFDEVILSNEQKKRVMCEECRPTMP